METAARLDMENKLRDQGVREMPPRYELDSEAQKHEGLTKLQNNFIKQKNFSFDDEIEVDGVRYLLSKSSDHTMKEMAQDDVKGMIAYGTRFREKARSKGLSDYILFLWGMAKGSNAFMPFLVASIKKSNVFPDTDADIEKLRTQGQLIEDEAKINIAKEKIIGSTVQVFISNIPNGAAIEAKVDTGADISSIHADEWNVNNGQVTFTNNEISPNEITLPVLEQQAIKTSNGQVEYRPVVSLNVKVNNVPMSDVMFNLNDRGSMTYSMLVGKNILERGGFLIDPKLDEAEVISEEEMMNDLDMDVLAEQFSDFDVPKNTETELIDIINYITNKK